MSAACFQRNPSYSFESLFCSFRVRIPRDTEREQFSHMRSGLIITTAITIFIHHQLINQTSSSPPRAGADGRSPRPRRFREAGSFGELELLYSAPVAATASRAAPSPRRETDGRRARI